MSRATASTWLVVWTALLLGTATWQRPVAEALRERGLLTLTVTAGLVAAGGLILRLLRRRDGDEPVPWLPLVLTLAVVGILLNVTGQARRRTVLDMAPRNPFTRIRSGRRRARAGGLADATWGAAK